MLEAIGRIDVDDVQVFDFALFPVVLFNDFDILRCPDEHQSRSRCNGKHIFNDVIF